MWRGGARSRIDQEALCVLPERSFPDRLPSIGGSRLLEVLLLYEVFLNAFARLHNGLLSVIDPLHPVPPPSSVRIVSSLCRDGCVEYPELQRFSKYSICAAPAACERMPPQRVP